MTNDLVIAAVICGCDITKCRSFFLWNYLINDILIGNMTFKKENAKLHRAFDFIYIIDWAFKCSILNLGLYSTLEQIGPLSYKSGLLGFGTAWAWEWNLSLTNIYLRKTTKQYLPIFEEKWEIQVVSRTDKALLTDWWGVQEELYWMITF